MFVHIMCVCVYNWKDLVVVVILFETEILRFPGGARFIR